MSGPTTSRGGDDWVVVESVKANPTVKPCLGIFEWVGDKTSWSKRV